MTDLLFSWPGGSMESTIKLVGLILGSYLVIIWLSGVVWVYRDVRNRTSDLMSQVVAVLLVGLFNLPGLVVYLLIRPQSTLTDAYERSLEAEAILHELQLSANTCQNCRRPIDDDFNVCPNCRTVLREACRNCSRPIRTTWVTCPYCAADRAPVRDNAGATNPAQRMPARRTLPLNVEAPAPNNVPTRPAVTRES